MHWKPFEAVLDWRKDVTKFRHTVIDLCKGCEDFSKENSAIFLVELDPNGSCVGTVSSFVKLLNQIFLRFFT